MEQGNPTKDLKIQPLDCFFKFLGKKIQLPYSIAILKKSHPHVCKVMNNTDNDISPLVTMVQLDLCYIMHCKVYCKALLLTQNVFCISLAVCPDHPLSLESVKVLLVCIVGGLKHCPIPLSCVLCYGTPHRRNITGLISQCGRVLFLYRLFVHAASDSH